MNALTGLYRELHRRVVERLNVPVEGCCGGPACGYPDPREPFAAYERNAQITRSSGWLGMSNEVRLDELCGVIERANERVAALEETVAALRDKAPVGERSTTTEETMRPKEPQMA